MSNYCYFLGDSTDQQSVYSTKCENKRILEGSNFKVMKAMQNTLQSFIIQFISMKKKEFQAVNQFIILENIFPCSESITGVVAFPFSKVRKLTQESNQGLLQFCSIFKHILLMYSLVLATQSVVFVKHLKSFQVASITQFLFQALASFTVPFQHLNNKKSFLLSE